MKRLIISFAMLWTVSIGFAEFNDLPEGVRTNLAAIQKYPLASSILLDCSESYVLNEDGSQVYEWHSFRYFPDEAARDAFGDPRINYIEGRQTVEILRARTYTPDGRQIDCTPENAFNPVVSDEMALAPDFGEYRQLVVTLLGLENGSISELHYRVSTPKPHLPWLEGRVYFREEVPVISRKLTIQIPTGESLAYKCDRGAPEPTADGTKYMWQIGEQRGYLADDLSGHRELLPNVEFTTSESWTEVCENLTTRIQAASSEPIIVPKSLRDAVAGIGTVDGRLAAIKGWVSERFNKIHFDHPEFKLTLRSANQVLNSGYGNGFEMALLVQTLAAEWAIKCDIYPRFLLAPTVPSLHEWTDPVLAVHPDFGTTFLTDPLAPQSETWDGISASTVYELANCAIREPWHKSTATPHFNVWLTLKSVDTDSVEGDGAFVATGSWGAFEQIQENGVDEYINGLITLPGFECGSAKIQELSGHRVAVDFDFTIAALDTADRYKIVQLAAMDFGRFLPNAPWRLPTREFSQAVPHMGEVALSLEVEIPDGWELVQKPVNSSETWDWSTGDVTSVMEDGRLSYSRRVNLVREWIAPSGWSGFRSWIINSGPRKNHCAVFSTK